MSRPEEVTSASNPLLKDIRKAIARGARTREGFAIAETYHLLEEALRSGCEIGAVVASQSALPQVDKLTKGLAGVRRIVLRDAVFQELSGTEAAQGVMALVRPRPWETDRLFCGRPLIVVLDGIQDPGNAGAVIRAAEAFGATGLMFLKGTVSADNPKAIRASAGSVFRVPLVTGLDAREAKALLEDRGVALFAAMPAEGIAPADADLTRPCAFAIGSEGRGVTAALGEGARALRIPVSGVESLNAAMAAGILLYETRRQRAVR